MLRAILLGFGCVVFLIGLLLALFTPAGAGAIPPLVMGVVIVGGLMLERHRYRAIADQPSSAPGWEMTRERFVDPGTEELMTVWYNRRTGKRLYVRSGNV